MNSTRSPRVFQMRPRVADETNGPDLSGFGAQLNEAEAALAAFARGPAQRAAADVADAFDKAGARIARSLARAGASGELSFKQLAKTILEEFAKVALDQVFANSGKQNFFGARAGGGAVNPGGAYLVGERGPEMFTPNVSGAVQPISGGVTVHFHLGAGADAQSVMRHQGQIAAQVARAVAYGKRNL